MAAEQLTANDVPVHPGQGILPFALADRWIVTVESERQLVKVRHRTRWYAVARRKGHEERRLLCASRADALAVARWQREAFDRIALAGQIDAMLAYLPPIQFSNAMARLEALVRQREGPSGNSGQCRSADND